MNTWFIASCYVTVLHVQKIRDTYKWYRVQKSISLAAISPVMILFFIFIIIIFLIFIFIFF